MQSPALNLCFSMDLPDFRPWCRADGDHGLANLRIDRMQHGQGVELLG
jgi:hypothetical protein